MSDPIQTCPTCGKAVDWFTADFDSGRFEADCGDEWHDHGAESSHTKEHILAERAAEELLIRAMAGDEEAIRDVVAAVLRDHRRTSAHRLTRAALDSQGRTQAASRASVGNLGSSGYLVISGEETP